MTLREMAEKAIWEHRPALAGRVADRLRGKGFDSPGHVWAGSRMDQHFASVLERNALLCR